MRRTRWTAGQAIRDGGAMLAIAALASCVAPPKPAPASPRPRPAPALPAALPQQDWRDVPLTPGTWVWRGDAAQASIAQFGLPSQAAIFALRCDIATRAIVFSRAGGVTAGGWGAAMAFTTSFGPFSLAASYGGGQPPAIVAQASARDPRMDKLAFSRGRFLVDMAGHPRLVLPAWPEVARVIEDCRG